MGMNLTIGIAIAFGCVFDKIFGTLAEKSTFHHCWQYGSQYYFRNISNLLLRNAKR
jgi:hypothetical protein